MFLNQNKITYLLAFSACLFISFFLWSSNLSALFSVIDDHLIISSVGSDHIYNLDDFLYELKNERDFQIGEYGRFRPAFQVGRMLEMLFFDDNVLYYQTIRFISFFLFIFITLLILIHFSNVLFGSMIFIIVLSESYWNDIYTRIITSEIFTIYGLIFFIPISIKIFQVIKNKSTYPKLKNKFIFYLYIFFYFIFGLLAIGSKENFIFLSIIPLFFIYLCLKHKYFDFSILLSSLVLVLYGIFILSVMLLYFLTTHDDISGYGIESQTLLKIAYSFANIFFIKWGGFLLFLPLVFKIFLKSKGEHKLILEEYNEITLSFFKGIILLAFLLLFQVIYYTGGLPSGTRYDFPSFYFFSIYLILSVIYFTRVMTLLNVDKVIIKRCIFILLSIVLIIKNPIGSFKSANIISLNHKANTIEFQSTIQSIIAEAESQVNREIIVNSFNVWDYELVSSVFKYLKYHNIKNKIYLKLHYSQDSYGSSVEKEFVRRLKDASDGEVTNPDWVFSSEYYQNEWGYDPILDFNSNDNDCISVNIRKNADNNCDTNILLTFNGP